MIKKAFIFSDVHEILIEKLENQGYQVIYSDPENIEMLPTHLSEATGIITSNKFEISAGIIDQAPNLKWIGRLGSGMEIIDTAYAKTKGIQCYNSPEGNANAVAEQALGMLLSLQCRIPKAHFEMQNQLWLRDENRGFEIEGKTAGIIGYGHNGAAFGKKLNALGVQVLAYDKYDSSRIGDEIFNCPDLSEIYEKADFLSFHVPLNEETWHYFNDDFLEKMQKNFVLLNLSRGPVVSLSTLYEGMKSGKILSAALDVWEKEPFWKMDKDLKTKAMELLTDFNFIGTPHIGGYTYEALYKMSFYLAEKILKN